MKTLLFFLLCLTLTTVHAQTWPRNQKTNKVEFTGVLPWPATAKTDTQRQALVRRWYLAKLTDSTPEEVNSQALANKKNGLLTYAQLPKVAVLQSGKGDTARYLAYTVVLIPSAKGMSVKMSGFNLNQPKSTEDINDSSVALESILSTATQNQQAALAELRKRLALATKSLQ